MIHSPTYALSAQVTASFACLEGTGGVLTLSTPDSHIYIRNPEVATLLALAHWIESIRSKPEVAHDGE